MAIVYDDLQRADENPLSWGGRWVVTLTNGVRLLSNLVKGTGAGQNRFCHWDTFYNRFGTNQFMAALINNATNFDNVELAINLAKNEANQLTFYKVILQKSSNNISLNKCLAGSQSLVATSAALDLTGEKWLEIRRVSNTVIEVYWNDVLVITWTDSGNPITEGQPAIGYNAGGSNLTQVKALEFGDVPGTNPQVSGFGADANTITNRVSTNRADGSQFLSSQGEGYIYLKQGSNTVTQGDPASWSDTLLNNFASDDGGVIKYGSVEGYVVADTLEEGYKVVQFKPPSGYDFTNLTSVESNPLYRIESTPDLAVGDQIEYDTEGGKVTVNPDGTFVVADETVTSFQVRIHDGVSWGDWFDQFVLNPDTTAPSDITGFQVYATGQTTGKATWLAATDAGSGIKGYRVELGGAVLPGLVTALEYDFADLLAGTTYAVRVRAVDNSDNEGSWTAARSFTTDPIVVPPPPPVDPLPTVPGFYTSNDADENTVRLRGEKDANNIVTPVVRTEATKGTLFEGTGVDAGDVLFTTIDVLAQREFSLHCLAGEVEIVATIDDTNYTSSPLAMQDLSATASGTYVVSLTAGKVGFLRGLFKRLRVRQVGATASSAKLYAG